MSDQENAAATANERLGLAREEWAHMLAIVGRKSESAIRIRGWLITVLAAISTGAFSDLITIASTQYLAVCLTVVTVFASMEFLEQLYHLRAMTRVAHIETILRAGDGQRYDGPLIDDCMNPTKQHKDKSHRRREWRHILLSRRFWAHQAIIAIGVVLIAVSLYLSGPCPN